MGQVGGNGSVVWQNKHLKGGGKKFKDKNDKGKLESDELRKRADLEVWGRDGIAFDDIGTTPIDDLEGDLDAFQTNRKEYFLVRLRFDDDEANAIESWFNATTPPPNVKMSRSGKKVVMALKVKAIKRNDWPKDDVTFADMPWEIRYDW